MIVIFAMFIGMLVLMLLYNIKSRAKTRDVLAKKKLKQRMVSPIMAFKKILIKTFDYKSRASLSEFWWGLLLYNVVTMISGQIMGYTQNPWLITFVHFVISLPIISLVVRRFSDSGSTPKIAILTYLCMQSAVVIGNFDIKIEKLPFYILLVISIAWVAALFVYYRNVLRASEPNKNKYGDVPNIEKIK